MTTGINKADVMRKAWSLYRTVRYPAEAKALAKGFRANRTRWVNCLRDAWAMLKAAARTAEEKLADLRELAHREVLSLEMIDGLTHRGTSSLAALNVARSWLAAATS